MGWGRDRSTIRLVHQSSHLPLTDDPQFLAFLKDVGITP